MTTSKARDEGHIPYRGSVGALNSGSYQLQWQTPVSGIEHKQADELAPLPVLREPAEGGKTV